MEESRKTCSQCGESKPLSEFHKRSKVASGYRAACKQCTSQYDKARERKYEGDAVLKQRVRMRTRDLINKGLLTPKPCKVCGTDENVQAHHLHYDKPDSHLAFSWMCVECHALEHATEETKREMNFKKAQLNLFGE